MTQPTLVLVHGAFSDHRAFASVRPLFERRGYRTVAPDLPGRGDDTTPLREINLRTHADLVTTVVDGQQGPVVLVGHSMAGAVVSQVAERRPFRLRRLIYVAAYLPRNGQCLLDLAGMDGESLICQAMEPSADGSTLSLRRERLVEALCADLPPAVQEIITMDQRLEAMAPFRDHVHLTQERFGRVPKAYLRTKRDRAVTPDLQRRMIATYPGILEASIDASHLPFLARPAEFVDKLIGLIEPGVRGAPRCPWLGAS